MVIGFEGEIEQRSYMLSQLTGGNHCRSFKLGEAHWRRDTSSRAAALRSFRLSFAAFGALANQA